MGGDRGLPATIPGALAMLAHCEDLELLMVGPEAEVRAALGSHAGHARLRVVPVTTHVPLRDVARLLTTERIVNCGLAAADALTRWMEQSPGPVDCEVTIALGTPLHEILEHARTLKADLLVAGIAGAGEMPAGAGSISSKLARKVQTPVLLVRTNHPQAFRKIVACIDFSESSRAVVEQAHSLARMDGAEVDFLHVWQEPWVAMAYPTPFADPGGPALVYTPEEREACIQRLRDELHEFVGKAAQGIESAEVLHEAPSHGNGIVEHAQEALADLIIVGGKGRTNLHYVLLGSTAERLLTRLPCSLLVVKLPEEN